MRGSSDYAFYPETAAGSRISLELTDLASDEAAQDWALDVLTQHASAACVEIWCGDRYVGRVTPDAREALLATGQVPTED